MCKGNIFIIYTNFFMISDSFHFECYDVQCIDITVVALYTAQQWLRNTSKCQEFSTKITLIYCIVQFLTFCVKIKTCLNVTFYLMLNFR
jgi:hypothetical protein